MNEYKELMQAIEDVYGANAESTISRFRQRTRLLPPRLERGVEHLCELLETRTGGFKARLAWCFGRDLALQAENAIREIIDILEDPDEYDSETSIRDVLTDLQHDIDTFRDKLPPGILPRSPNGL
jgi:hypothetical protein